MPAASSARQLATMARSDAPSPGGATCRLITPVRRMMLAAASPTATTARRWRSVARGGSDPSRVSAPVRRRSRHRPSAVSFAMGKYAPLDASVNTCLLPLRWTLTTRRPGPADPSATRNATTKTAGISDARLHAWSGQSASGPRRRSIGHRRSGRRARSAMPGQESPSFLIFR